MATRRKWSADRKHQSNMNRYYRSVNAALSRAFRKAEMAIKRAARHKKTR